MADRPFSASELAEPGEAVRVCRRLLAEQLRYVRTASAFYRRKLGDGPDVSVDDLAALPFTTKDELRKAQAADPPFGEIRAAPQSAIIRLHVTSGTSGRPLAIGFTRADHERSCEIGAAAYFAAGIRADDTVLHCLNYALYVGGLADHLSIEHIGATMVPVGIGQTDRILDLWDDIKPTVVFSTPSYARHLAGAALARGREPATLGLRLLVVGGEPGGDIPETRRALQGTCSHEYFELDKGFLTAGTLTCALHLSRFDLSDGEPLDPPAELPLEVYPVVVEDGRVLIEVGDGPLPVSEE